MYTSFEFFYVIVEQPQISRKSEYMLEKVTFSFLIFIIFAYIFKVNMSRAPYYQYIILHKAKNQVDLFQGARDMFTLKIYAKMIKIRNENVTFSSIYCN
jgi:hypothetical protein